MTEWSEKQTTLTMRVAELMRENERIYKEYSKTFTRSDNVQIKRENLYMLQNALDLLGVALAEHKHTWSVEERTAYDKATRIINDEKGA